MTGNVDVTIARCTADDIDDVIRFIDQHWKRRHALVASRLLLDWQHREADGTYSLMIARGGDRTMLGMIGYIATRRFDPSLATDNVIWLTTWKVRGDAGVAGLGLRLLLHAMRAEAHCGVGALMPSDATAPIYRSLGFQVGELQHYVRFNDKAVEPRIAQPPATPETRLTGAPPLIRPLITDDDFSAFEWPPHPVQVPTKTAEYFRQRYAHHPVYSYDVVGLVDGGTPAGLLVTRVAEHDHSRALRIVDFRGSHDVWSRIGPVVQQLLEDADAEYADVYNAGIDARVFAQAGFTCVEPDGHVVVPDHFEPFEHRNVRLWFAFKGPRPVLFKGDGDQDRPNVVPGYVE